MADLRVKGDYVGPGEQKTAEHLAGALADHWVIFAGRKLPGPNRDDADLVIVGQNLIFVVEEKAWGPTVVVDDNHWYVGTDPRPNPLNRVAQVARIVATTLKQNAKGYKNLKRPHRVIPAVVLSHSNLQVLGGANHDEREHIWSLKEAASALTRLDHEFNGPPLGQARRSVIAYLDDLPKPVGKPTLGPYRLESRLASAGQEQSWSAVDSAGEPVLLKSYPMADLGGYGDPEEFLQREYVAVNRVADLARTWRAYPPFKDDSSGLFVVPVVPPRGGMTLHQSVHKGVPERVDGQLDPDLARAVVIDAFTGLNDLHDAGLAHRALHPKRVWLHKRRRIMFSDLNLARVVGDASIALWAVDGDMSEDFRAPECAASISLATPKSDVYSLGMCMAYWLLGRDVLALTYEQLRLAVVDAYPWAEPMLKALSGDPKDRPEAEQLADELKPVRPETPAVTTELGVFEVGGLIDDRYEILERLGRGGFATSWKVYDRQRELPLVLKQFHADLPENVRAEFRAAHLMHSDYLGGVYDLHVNEAPLYIVSEYVEGESLGEEGQAFTVEQLRTIAADVLTGLDYIHGRDFIHGDVTPSNVIVTPDGNSAKLIDFGLMVRSGERPTGQTPKFAAPELVRGAPATIASDLYGFAATMTYAMLGRPISSTASGNFELLLPTSDETLAWDPGGARLLETFLSGVKEDPAERPQSAEDFLSLVRSTQLAPRSEGPAADDEYVVNDSVGAIRRLYRASADSNAGNRGLDDSFARTTYVTTRLDDRLLPRVLAGELDVVLLSGNPGDGKTSLLVQLGQELIASPDAKVLYEDDAGWAVQHHGRTFHAVFDASESHGDLSSDELVKRALEPVRSGKDGPATALIAINDGRLHQFFEDNSHAYEDWWFEIQDQLSGKDAGGSRIVLVDLKRRALASVDGEALADRALRALVRSELWEDCSSCAARALCPILSNRQSLAGEGAEAFSELMLISHLRRRRRATFRDVRSAAAWLITGDRDCPDVHALVKEGKDPRLMPHALTHDLAFATESNDYLVDEWSDLDPALVPSPAVDRARRLASGAERPLSIRNADSAARAIFFGDHSYPDIGREHVRMYRYLDEFLGMLTGADPVATRDRLLLGMSRLLGAPGYAQPGLAFSMGARDSRWAVLHVIEPESFTVEVADPAHRYLETIPDLVELHYKDGVGHRLPLNLDTAELILRAADGELVDDSASDAIRQEIDAFVGQLSMHPSKAAHIVDSSGSVSRATISGADIAFDIEGGVPA